MSSYKLAQFVSSFIETNRPGFVSSQTTPNQIYKDMLNSTEVQEMANKSTEEVENLRTVIRPRTARLWLNKLGYRYTDIKKGVFLDGHERPDVVEDRGQFLGELERLSPYLVEFQEDGSMVPKEYPPDCAVGGPNRRPCILITHDESTFSANDGNHQAWLMKGHAFLRPKSRGKGIMASDFLLPWKRLNLFHLRKEEREALVAAGVPEEAAEIFEYGQEDGYWDGAKVVNQIRDKALPIVEALYPGYEAILVFDNAKSHAIFAKDALRVTHMSKSSGGVQPFIRHGWYEKNGTRYQQQMWYTEPNETGEVIRVQKGIQRILKERELWPQEGLRLECPTPKCGACTEMVKCKDCVKAKRCEPCKEKRVHSSPKCIPQRKCDACVKRKDSCSCTVKIFFARCTRKTGRKCEDCEDLPERHEKLGKFNPKNILKHKLNQLDCCARHYLSQQPDFLTQKCEIEELISEWHGLQYRVLYYPKFHCELNHIEHFWAHAKRYARD